MFFCVAAILDDESQYFIRKTVVKLNEAYGVGVVASLLPQHVSLKISFSHNSIKDIESYLDSVTPKFHPFSVGLVDIELVNIVEDGNDTGILWYSLGETRILQNIHTQLNDELSERFEVPIARFDGPHFRFHSTIVQGRKSFAEYKEMHQLISDSFIARSLQIEKIGLFCSHERSITPGTFYHYKTWHLT